MRAGQPEVVEGSHRMQEWSKCVQSSIAWASGIDIGQSFARTREESSGNAEREHLLLLLQEQFGTGRFTSAEVYDLMRRDHGSIRVSERLQAAMTAKSPVRAVGRAIGQLVGGYYGDGSRGLIRKKVNGQTVFQVQTKGPIAVTTN